MLRRWVVLGVAGTALVAGVVVTGLADNSEQPVSLDQVPAAVKATILKEAQGAAIKEIEAETKGGVTVYEAVWIVQGKEVEIKVGADGALLGKEIEEAKEEGEDEEEEGEEEEKATIPLDQVPAPARQALTKLAGGVAITKVEMEKEHGVVTYEAKWTAAGQEHEGEVAADGALVELEEGVAAENVPQAVRDAAAKLLKGAEKLTFEKKTVILYEVKGTVAGKEREVMVSPSGKAAKRGPEGRGKHREKGDDDEGDEDDEHEDKK